MFQSRVGFSLRRDRGFRYSYNQYKGFSNCELNNANRQWGLYTRIIRVDESFRGFQQQLTGERYSCMLCFSVRPRLNESLVGEVFYMSRHRTL